MSKNKLAKFAEMASYDHVIEAPFQTPDTPYHPLRGKWHAEFFKNDNPIVLELGCGRGEYCVGLGRMFPNKNFIGVDIKGARMYTGATEAKNEGLTNVGFLRTHIEFIDKFFTPNEVAEIWLTFSDPQMRKATKRLTSTYFLERYRRLLQDNGIVHLKTLHERVGIFIKYDRKTHFHPIDTRVIIEHFRLNNVFTIAWIANSWRSP